MPASDDLNAKRLDAEDPLAPFRERFVIRDPELIYLDGNSLGRLPKAAIGRARALVEAEWGERLIRGWNEGWIDAPARVGAKIAELIGAHADEVIVADSTSVNLFKLAVAALRYQKGRSKIVTDDLNFPSDLYVLQGIGELLGEECEVRRVASEDGVHGPVEEIQAHLDERTALLTLSHVVFKSGYLYDMAALTRAAHEVGALTLWDLSHSVGSVPIDLGASGADLAVGCSYKYLNGGPGAPAFLYVRRELQAKLANPISGWMGKKDAFDFALDYEPEAGVRKFLTGTPSVVSLALIEPGVELLLEAGMAQVREKSLKLSGYLLELIDTHLAPLGFRLASPRDPARRGSHVSLSHPQALAIDLAMIHELQVIPDFRPPESIRLGLTPLYTSFGEICEAVKRIERIVVEGRHEKYLNDAPVVT
jgi:kynureninase